MIKICIVVIVSLKDLCMLLFITLFNIDMKAELVSVQVLYLIIEVK